MLHQVLPIIVAELNAFLLRTANETEDIALLSDLVDQGGNTAFGGGNKVVCTLISLEQERSTMNARPTGAIKMNAPVNLNLNLLFSCHSPGNYVEALKSLSLVVSFFQGKQVFTPSNTPGLPEEARKVNMEFIGADLHAQSQMWGALGAKLVPSAYMKLRMVPISRGQILEEIPEITGVDTSTGQQP